MKCMKLIDQEVMTFPSFFIHNLKLQPRLISHTVPSLSIIVHTTYMYEKSNIKAGV